MIPTKTRESRRVKALKLPKNLDRLYKEGKCRECAVVVTRMDFAKILGKFTKVKIQYQSSSTPKAKQNSVVGPKQNSVVGPKQNSLVGPKENSLVGPKQNSAVTPSISNARLKSNENGMVLIHNKNKLSEHPVKQQGPKKPKRIELPQPARKPNILKENNILKKPIIKAKISNYDDQNDKCIVDLKKYAIVFEDPLTNNNNIDNSSQITLSDLLTKIDQSVLPSDEWCIDYFPKTEEPKDDKVYDRIAAELEDLMYNDKPILKTNEKTDGGDGKVDEFPSIMDILNDNSSESKPSDQNNSLDFKSNLESSDVEAMLLGKSNPQSNPAPPTPMEVDNTLVGNLIEDVSILNDIQGTVTNDVLVNKDDSNKTSLPADALEVENPHSPSILDEALQKGIEEHLPLPDPQTNSDNNIHAISEVPSNEGTKTEVPEDSKKDTTAVTRTSENTDAKEHNFPLATISGITHVVFKKARDGTCYKSVTCPKNLKYTIELDGKPVEFLGAPKFISNLEDLKVLLQIVDESELDSLYVLH